MEEEGAYLAKLRYFPGIYSEMLRKFMNFSMTIAFVGLKFETGAFCVRYEGAQLPSYLLNGKEAKEEESEERKVCK
jgi:hypothetical protein